MKNNKPLALILGGSSGMGLASARYLSARGYELCLVYRERKSDEAVFKEELKSFEPNPYIKTFNKDALRDDIIDQILNEIKEDGKKISLVLHSIAKGNLKPIVPGKENDSYADVTIREHAAQAENFLQKEDFALTIDAMALSYYNWVKAIFNKGLFNDKASVLALSSEGSSRAWLNYAAVSAAKAALEAISRSIALEMAPYGVRSNIIQAGVCDTRALRMIKGHELIKEQSLLRNPFGRLTTPEDVAKVVYLLGTQESEWINGAIIPVDGGESIA